MLTEKAIRQIAALMRRLHGADAERFVEGAIARFDGRHTRPDTVEIWRHVRIFLAQTALPPTSEFLRSPPSPERLDGRSPD